MNVEFVPVISSIAFNLSHHPWFDRAVSVVIVLNSIALALTDFGCYDGDGLPAIERPLPASEAEWVFYTQAQIDQAARAAAPPAPPRRRSPREQQQQQDATPTLSPGLSGQRLYII